MRANLTGKATPVKARLVKARPVPRREVADVTQARGPATPSFYSASALWQ
jgi:hypothetical protein